MAEATRTAVYVYEQVVILASCILSFFGSLLIICTYLRWLDLRTTPRKLLVYLSVSDLLSALSYFYGVVRIFDSDSSDCIAQGAISTFANTSSFFWTVAIAIYLYTGRQLGAVFSSYQVNSSKHFFSVSQEGLKGIVHPKMEIIS